MAYLAGSDEDAQSAAVRHLEKARDQWKRLAEITKSHYLTHEVWLVGQFDWAMYLPQAEKDIDIAREMDPWSRATQTWTSADGKKSLTWPFWHAEGWPKDIEPWVRDFNSRVQSCGAKIKIPAGSSIKASMDVDLPGVAVVRLSSPERRKSRLTSAVFHKHRKA